MALVCEGCRKEAGALEPLDDLRLCIRCVVSTVRKERELRAAELQSHGREVQRLRENVDQVNADCMRVLDEIDDLCKQHGLAGGGIDRLPGFLREQLARLSDGGEG